jgi:hypothetical protein
MSRHETSLEIETVDTNKECYEVETIADMKICSTRE